MTRKSQIERVAGDRVAMKYAVGKPMMRQSNVATAAWMIERAKMTM